MSKFDKCTFNPFSVPIVINNFNRLTYLQKLISRLEEDGYERIYVLDNQSTYPDLLDYYADIKHEVFYLRKNFGYLALWETEVYDLFRDSYYLYTDPDVLPDPACPSDFVRHFFEVLQKYPNVGKVGFGLRVDDLPDGYRLKSAVIGHEKQHWAAEVEAGLFRAPIDTTMALYRPHVQGGWWVNALRTASPYIARHLPWYENSMKMDPEMEFYRKNVKQSTYWSRLR